MKLLADENFNRFATDALRGRGVDVLAVTDPGSGLRGWLDPEILAYATAVGRAVLTYNHRDFRRLHRDVPGHGGIVSLKANFPTAEDQAEAILAASGEIGPGKLVRLTWGR